MRHIERLRRTGTSSCLSTPVPRGAFAFLDPRPMQAAVCATLAILRHLSAISSEEGALRSIAVLAVCACIATQGARKRANGVSELGCIFIYVPSVSRLEAYRTPDRRRLLGLDFDLRERGRRHVFAPCDALFISDAHLEKAAQRCSAQVLQDVHGGFGTTLLILPPQDQSKEVPDLPLFAQAFCSVIAELSTALCLEGIRPSDGFRLWSASGSNGHLATPERLLCKLACLPTVVKGSTMLVAQVTVRDLPSASIIALSGSKGASVTRAELLGCCQMLSEGKRIAAIIRLHSLRFPILELVKESLLHSEARVHTLALAFRDAGVEGTASKLRRSLRHVCESLQADLLTPLPSLYHCVRVALVIKRLACMHRRLKAVVTAQPQATHVAGQRSVDVSVQLMFQSGKSFVRTLKRRATLYLMPVGRPSLSIASLEGVTRCWIVDGGARFTSLSVTHPGDYQLHVYVDLPPPLSALTVATRTFSVFGDVSARKGAALEALSSSDGITSDSVRLTLQTAPQQPSQWCATRLTLRLLSRYHPDVVVPLHTAVKLTYTCKGCLPVGSGVKRTVPTARGRGYATGNGPPPQGLMLLKSMSQKTAGAVFDFTSSVAESTRRQVSDQHLLPWHTDTVVLEAGVGTVEVSFPAAGTWQLRGWVESQALQGRSVGVYKELCVGTGGTACGLVHAQKTEELLRANTLCEWQLGLVNLEFALSMATLFMRRTWLLARKIDLRALLGRTELEEEEEREWQHMSALMDALWIQCEYMLWTSLNMVPTVHFTSIPDEVAMNESFEVVCRLGWNTSVVSPDARRRYVTPAGTECVLVESVELLPPGRVQCVSPFAYFVDGRAATTMRLSHAGVTAFTAVCELRALSGRQCRVEAVSSPVRVRHVPTSMELDVGPLTTFKTSEPLPFCLTVIDANGCLCTNVTDGTGGLSPALVSCWRQEEKSNRWEPLSQRKFAVRVVDGKGTTEVPRLTLSYWPSGTYKLKAFLVIPTNAQPVQLECMSKTFQLAPSRGLFQRTTKLLKKMGDTLNPEGIPMFSQSRVCVSTQPLSLFVQSRKSANWVGGYAELAWCNTVFPQRLTGADRVYVAVKITCTAVSDLHTPSVSFALWGGTCAIVKPFSVDIDAKSLTAATTLIIPVTLEAPPTFEFVAVEASLRQHDGSHLVTTSPPIAFSVSQLPRDP